MNNQEELAKKYEKIKKVVEKHTEKLNIMKENLSRCDEEKWSDIEIAGCVTEIRILAAILSDLNKIIKYNE